MDFCEGKINAGIAWDRGGGGAGNGPWCEAKNPRFSLHRTSPPFDRCLRLPSLSPCHEKVQRPEKLSCQDYAPTWNLPMIKNQT